MNIMVSHIHRELDEFSKDINISQILGFLESFENLVIEIVKKKILT